MDVREKLAELLNKANSACVGTDCFEGCKFYMENDCLYKFMADHLISNGVTVQEWNPISKSPKKGTYLVCTENGGVLLGHWYGTKWNVGGGAKKHLAYWMEKPQPPKGE